MRKQLKLILSATFFLLLLIYAVALFFQTSVVLGRRSEPGGIPFQINNEVRVRQLVSVEAKAALRPGDEIIAINGIAITSDFRIAEIFNAVEPDSNYVVTIRRG